MQKIPTNPVASQQIYWQLPPAGAQDKPATLSFDQWLNLCRGVQIQINLHQRRTGLFADVYMSESLLLAGVLCQDRNSLIRSAYLGFPGDLAIVDQQGADDPDYTGLGTRFCLFYFAPGETPFNPVVVAT